MVSVNFFLKLYYNWWKNIDKKILFLILLLFGLSLFFSLTSTSLIASEKLNTEDYYFSFNFPTRRWSKFINLFNLA